MQSDGPKPKSYLKDLQGMGDVLSLGILLGLCLAFGLGIGLALDHWLGIKPWGLALGLIWGIGAGIHQSWKILKEAQEKLARDRDKRRKGPSEDPQDPT